MSEQVPQVSSVELEQRGRLIQLGVLNNLGTAVTLVTGLVMVPFMLAGLGSHDYGAWIMIISLSGLVMSVDLGLALVVTREVARTGASAPPDASRVARAAGGTLLIVGAVGWLAMVVIGFSVALRGDSTGGTAPPGLAVFLLVGLAMFMDQLLQYCLAVLAGRLRYGIANLVSSFGVVLRAGLVLLALEWGADLFKVAAAYATGAAATAVLAAAVVRRVDPAHAPGKITFDLRTLRPQLQFGLTSLVATAAGALLWQVHPLMIGAIVGPAAVVAYYVGMRIPMLVSEASWRMADVLFPAVSSMTPGGAPGSGVAVALSTGMRWLTLIVLPLAVVGFVLAPSILDAWLGERPAGADLVMRIGAIVVLLDAWLVSAIQVLWALGSTGRIASTMAGAAALAIGLNLVLLPLLGAAAAPAAMIAGLALAAVLLLRSSVAGVDVKVSGLIFKDVIGLLPAGAACGLGTLLGALCAGDGDAARVALGSLVGLAAYLAAIRFTPAVAQERKLLTSGVARSADLLREAMYVLRAKAKTIAPLRSAWYLAIVLRRRLAYRSTATSASLDQLFDASIDPWRYDSPSERARHAIAEKFVARIGDSGFLQRVLEIGCAEGTFTELLAPRCDSLLCVDVSHAALERARGRRQWGDSVRFARFDLLKDALPGPFTAIVVMDVLTYFESVAHLRAIREKIIAALEPGAWLLVGDVRQSEVYETSWWGRKLLCGGLRISEFMAAHGQLALIAQADTDTHVFRLLRKKQ